MRAPQHILVPIDGSTSSLRACDEAVALATSVGARITLLQVIEPSPYVLPREVTDAVREMTQRDLEHHAAALKVHVKGAITSLMTEGPPWSEIVRVAEELSVDLIAMGTHGRSGLTHMLLGSVAERVVRTAPMPVLTVPAHAFTSELEAASLLAAAMRPLEPEAPAIVALSRAALPIASIVARSLSGTLDLWLTMPIIAAGKTIGAMGEDEQIVLVPDAILGTADQEATRAALREELWTLRGGRSMGPTRERPIVVVAQGLASGLVAIVAARALRAIGPRSMVLATPIASRDALTAVREHFDRVVCLKSTILGDEAGWYRTSSRLSDRAARELLEPVVRSEAESTRSLRGAAAGFHDTKEGR